MILKRKLFKKTVLLFSPYLTSKGWLPLVISLFTILLSALITLLLPYFSKSLSDNLYHQAKNIDLVFIVLGLVVLSQAINKILNHVLEIVFFPIVNEAIKDISLKVVKESHFITLEEYEKLEQGAVLSALKRIALSARTFMRVTFIQIIPSVLKLISSLVSAFTIHWFFTGTQIILGLFFTFSFFQIKWILKRRVQAWNTTDKATQIIAESLNNTENVRINFEFESKKLAGYLQNEADVWQKYNSFFHASYIALEAIHAIGISLLLGFGLYQVSKQYISPGEFIFLQGLLYTIIRESKNLINQVLQLREVEVDMSKIIDLLESGHNQNALFYKNNFFEKKEQEDFEALDIKHLSFAYQGQKSLLNDITLSINKGDKVFIYGQSGAGKSSLLKVMARLHTVHPDVIFINKKSYETYSESAFNHMLQYIPQKTILFNDTVLNNLCYGLHALPTNEEINKVLKIVHLSNLIDELPTGLNSLIGSRGAKISGGEQQRLILARALLFKPKVLLLDEALSSLEKNLEKDIIKEIFKIIPTVIIVSHRSEFTSWCSKIYHLKPDGKLYEEAKAKVLSPTLKKAEFIL